MRALLLSLCLAFSLASAAAAYDQSLLLNAVEDSEAVGLGGKIAGPRAELADAAIGTKVGQAAVRVSGTAAAAGDQGECLLAQWVGGTVKTLSLWVYAPADGNVARLGLQIQDKAGKALLWTTEVKSGEWVELKAPLDPAAWKPAGEQGEAPSAIEAPLQSVRAVWQAAGPGATALVIDGLSAVAELTDEPTVRAKMDVAPWVALGSSPRAAVTLTNYGGEPAKVTLRYQLQADSMYYNEPAPDAVHGRDHALGAKSWAVADGETFAANALTDGKDWTSAATPHKKDHYEEAFQYIDLGTVRHITRMTWTSGDANHTWKVDVSASADGTTYEPVAGLQGVDHFKQWGTHVWPIEQPFDAHYLRFRYHQDGRKETFIAFPRSIGVYDGTAGETLGIPKVGEVLDERTLDVTVSPHAYQVFTLPMKPAGASGACLLAALVEAGPAGQLMYDHLFVQLPAAAGLANADSRFGMNASDPSLAETLKQHGFGWVRFENGKWPFFNREPGVYTFDGSIHPNVDADGIFGTYAKAGLSTLTYVFMTAPFYSSAPEGTPENRRAFYPPKDYAKYGEFCFQLAARYGSTKHPAEELMTADKKSGLGLVQYYEMWNEPNLNAPSWGPWVATMAEYYDMMRFGAEAVRRADPNAVVTTCGYAGMTSELVDPLATHTYADGKHPLDFVDMLNVHYYSGLVPPEIATKDGNADTVGERTFVQELQELVQWRDKHKPSMPIWMTETGYDSAGPFGTNEWTQSARLPRVVMLCLANGMDKVFIYRESGSTPSKHAASGLLRNDKTIKPSWQTAGTMVRQLHGVRGGARRLPTPGANVYMLIWNEDKDPIVTVWTVDGEAKLGVDLGECQVVDAFGRETTRPLGEATVINDFPIYIRKVGSAEALKVLQTEATRLAEQEQARVDRQKRLTAYLYDFGSREFVGTLHLGENRRFTPVMPDEVWSEGAEFGFCPKPAMEANDARWRGEPIERDSCKVRGEETAFRVSAKPGKYELRVRIYPFGEKSDLHICGAAGGEKTVTVSKSEGLAVLPVEVGEEPLTVYIDGYASIHWLTLIERE